MTKCLHFKVVWFVWLSFVQLIYSLQINLEINFTNKGSSCSLAANWITGTCKYNVTYRRQLRLTHRISTEKHKTSTSLNIQMLSSFKTLLDRQYVCNIFSSSSVRISTHFLLLQCLLLTWVTAAICVEAGCTCPSNILNTDAITATTITFKHHKSYYVWSVYVFAFQFAHLGKKHPNLHI